MAGALDGGWLKGIRVERARQFGDVYLALALWPRDGAFAQLAGSFALPAKEQVAWERRWVVVTARLCEPQ